MEILSSELFLSDRQHSCDTDGCIPVQVGLSPHRQGWKEYHRNVVEGRPDSQNSVYPSFKLLKRFDHLIKLTNTVTHNHKVKVL